jgi:hypothetical protein
MKSAMFGSVGSGNKMLSGLMMAGLLTLISSEAQADNRHGHEHHDQASVAAHVHGEAALNIVIDGALILAEFISPLENLLGFEHKPTTPEQKQAFQGLQQNLMDYQALFELTDASCTQIEQHTTSPFSQANHAHAEWHSEYHLQCSVMGETVSIKPQLFSAYPGLEKLTVQMITEQGQSELILSSDKDIIPLR